MEKRSLHLGLAGSSGRSRRAGTSGGGVSVCRPWADLAMGEGCDVRNLCVLQRASCFSTGWALSLLLVRGNIKGDEEHEVGAEEDDASECSELLSSALAHIWHPWPVGGCEVGIRGEVYEDYHMILLATSAG